MNGRETTPIAVPLPYVLLVLIIGVLIGLLAYQL